MKECAVQLPAHRIGEHEGRCCLEEEHQRPLFTSMLTADWAHGNMPGSLPRPTSWDHLLHHSFASGLSCAAPGCLGIK